MVWGEQDGKPREPGLIDNYSVRAWGSPTIVQESLCSPETITSEPLDSWNYCRFRISLETQNNSSNNKTLLWSKEVGPKHPTANASEDSSMNQKLFPACYAGQEKKNVF